MPRCDPRLYQIAALTGLLAFGIWRLDFEISAVQMAVTLLTVLGMQCLAMRLNGVGGFEWKSALISGLSLCLLLRTSSPWLATVGAGVAIGSKFVLRWRGKHVFNPTNFALVFLLLCANGCAWVSPGQWGSVAFFAFLFVCLGGLVVSRAGRADVALSFLAFYLGLLFARSVYLGEPLAIPLHRMQSGTLLLFAFFMISDPRTTPDSRTGRIIFALLVATGAWYVQFRLFRTNGLLWSLALSALTRAGAGPRFPRRPPPLATVAFLFVSTRAHSCPYLHEITHLTHRVGVPARAPVLTPTLSAASTSPRPTQSSSTRLPRSCWCARTTRPC